jgi:RNA polymerase sigma-70 factor (ECF subfamily)
MDETRASLLIRVRDPQDAESWNEFYALYQPFLYRIARRQGLSEIDSEEVVAEVFAKIQSAIREFEYGKSPGRFRGWLKTVTIRTLQDRFRKLGRRKEISLEAVEYEQGISDDLDAQWEKEYRQRILEFAQSWVRQRSQETTWACFQQHVLEGRPAAEVGEALGLKANAVYVNASRVLKKVREKCLEYEEDTTKEGTNDA